MDLKTGQVWDEEFGWNTERAEIEKLWTEIIRQKSFLIPDELWGDGKKILIAITLPREQEILT